MPELILAIAVLTAIVVFPIGYAMGNRNMWQVLFWNGGLSERQLRFKGYEITEDGYWKTVKKAGTGVDGLPFPLEDVREFHPDVMIAHAYGYRDGPCPITVIGNVH